MSDSYKGVVRPRVGFTLGSGLKFRLIDIARHRLGHYRHCIYVLFSDTPDIRLASLMIGSNKKSGFDILF